MTRLQPSQVLQHHPSALLSLLAWWWTNVLLLQITLCTLLCSLRSSSNARLIPTSLKVKGSFWNHRCFGTNELPLDVRAAESLDVFKLILLKYLPLFKSTWNRVLVFISIFKKQLHADRVQNRWCSSWVQVNQFQDGFTYRDFKALIYVAMDKSVCLMPWM